MKTIRLDRVATALDVHPRTVLRALDDEVNTYWAPGHNPTVGVEEVAEAFGCDARLLRRAIMRRDELLRTRNAAAVARMSPRNLRYKIEAGVLVPAVRHKKVLRFSRQDLVEHRARR